MQTVSPGYATANKNVVISNHLAIAKVYLFTGVWEQWDTIVFPKESKFSDGSESKISIDPENQELVVARCLIVYLLSYQMKLQSNVTASAIFSISQMVFTVEQIFIQLKNRLIGHLSSNRTCFTNYKLTSQRLNSVSSYSIIAS